MARRTAARRSKRFRVSRPIPGPNTQQGDCQGSVARKLDLRATHSSARGRDLHAAQSRGECLTWV